MKITLILPIQDIDAQRIYNCLHSLRLQTLKDFEILIHNAGSKARWKDHIERAIAKTKSLSIKYIETSRKDSWDLAEALNHGVLNSKTPYVILSHVDNIFPPEFIEHISSVLSDNTLCFGDNTLDLKKLKPELFEAKLRKFDWRFFENNFTPKIKIPFIALNKKHLYDIGGAKEECFSSLLKELPKLDQVKLNLPIYHQPHEKRHSSSLPNSLKTPWHDQGHKIGIGVITYNRCGALKNCLNSILRNTTGQYKLVVADDGSTDDTIPYLQQKKVAFIAGKNEGVSVNKNRALFHLQDCDHIYLIEDDVFPTRIAWQNIYIEAIKESAFDYFSRSSPSWETRSDRYVAELAIPNHKFTYLKTNGCRGQVYIVTKRVLKAVGGVSEEFTGFGYEHIDWTLRIKQAGLAGFGEFKISNIHIDVKEARDCFRSPVIEGCLSEEKRIQEIQKNEAIMEKRRSKIESGEILRSEEYLQIKDPLINKKYLIKYGFKI